MAEQEFFLRQLYLSRFLAEADAFIAPSRFLAQRYIEWGLPEGRFHVIENGMVEEVPTISPAVQAKQGRELVFGFFGQISCLKGANVLIKAAHLLAEEKCLPPVRIEMHGDQRILTNCWPKRRPISSSVDLTKTGRCDRSCAVWMPWLCPRSGGRIHRW